jgi:hypothetical protein
VLHDYHRVDRVDMASAVLFPARFEGSGFRVRAAAKVA